MIKVNDLIRYGEFNKFLFYGEKELPKITLKTVFGEFDLSKIEWDTVKRVSNGFYDYGHALCQVVNRPNANIISYLLDKICKVVLFGSDNENDKELYACLEIRKKL